jgi:hypothetical protein
MNAARLARRWDEAHGNTVAMAEALADELQADLVTKADLAAAVSEIRAEMQSLLGDFRGELHSQGGELRTEMQALRGDLRAEIHSQGGTLVRWTAGLLLVHAFGVAGVVVGLVRLLG